MVCRERVESVRRAGTSSKVECALSPGQEPAQEPGSLLWLLLLSHPSQIRLGCFVQFDELDLALADLHLSFATDAEEDA